MIYHVVEDGEYSHIDLRDNPSPMFSDLDFKTLGEAKAYLIAHLAETRDTYAEAVSIARTITKADL